MSTGTDAGTLRGTASTTGAGTPALHHKRLSTYLNDHLAVAIAGAEVSKRTLSSNTGTPYEPLLKRIADDLEGDKRLLREVMRSLDVREDPLKRGLAWVGEKLGRLKLNDSLTSYSPLSRAVELEALMVVETLLRNTWATLDEVLGGDTRAPDVTGARDRAARNLRELEEHRPAAMREALTAG
jgi:hypothetical protein